MKGVDLADDNDTQDVNITYYSSPDKCHWCGVEPATRVLMVQEQTSEHSALRLLRVDHLCEDCATAYWSAIHNAQKELMF